MVRIILLQFTVKRAIFPHGPKTVPLNAITDERHFDLTAMSEILLADSVSGFTLSLTLLKYWILSDISWKE